MKMNRYQDRTVRKSGQWVKITRDNQDRSFTFARGYQSEYKAHDIETLSFKWVANWTEAVERAERSIATFA